MKNYYNSCELDFFISTIDDIIKDYKDKIDSLYLLRNDFFDELKNRGENNG